MCLSQPCPSHVCVCVCVPRTFPSRGEGTPRIRGKPRLGAPSTFPGPQLGQAGLWLASLDCFLQGELLTCHHILLQVRGFTLPRATLSLQKDILKTRTLVLSTLLPNRLGLWLVATAMDRPARLCPQLLPGLELAEAPDTVSQPSRLAARTWRERPRPQASGPVPRAPQKTQPGPPFPPGARASQAHDQPDAHPPESAPQVPAAGAPAGLHPSGKL